ncbi:MAG: hypothetical protein FJZ59_00750 [Chlamydiae bacterium]|jgi:hypothetical protein|nr:hypothetical protein [Chlamydiota bacterium]
MNHLAKKNLQKVIESFLSESNRIVSIVETHPEKLQGRDLEILAEKIWDLRHFSIELLNQFPDESTWYNASIIKELVDEPIAMDPNKRKKTSLIAAADLTKKSHNDKTLRHLLRSWTIEKKAREVLFSNLREISKELAS